MTRGNKKKEQWQTWRKNKQKEQDDNKKKDTCFKPSNPQV